MVEKQSRWKSPVAWASFIIILLNGLRTIFGLQVPVEEIEATITALITLVGAFGIYNNPENKNTF